MNPTDDQGRRLYRVRQEDGEDAWVDHEELWRLQQGQADSLRRARARRQRRLLLVLAGVVAVALMLAFWRVRSGFEATGADPELSGPSADPGPPAVESGLAVPVEDQPPPAAEEPPSIEVESPVPPEPATDRVTEAVESWLTAWQSQDVAAYLASYDTAFEPAEGLSPPAWRSLRRRRIETPSSIQLEIEELEITASEAGRAEARFLQRYSSPIYADVVRKTLELVEVDGQWRIVSEMTVAP